MQQPSPTITHSISVSQNGKAVTIFPQESSANNDTIISNDGENNELHGDVESKILY
jgi:hypothetical protein